MRDKIIHEYFGVSLQIIWQTIEEDLSSLESSMEKLIAEAEQDQETEEDS